MEPVFKFTNDDTRNGENKSLIQNMYYLYKNIYRERNYHIFSFYKFIFNSNLKYIMQKFLMQKKMGRIESLLGMGP